MFSAVILICINGIKEPDSCEVYTNVSIAYSRNECIELVMDIIESREFEFYINEYEKFDIVDFRCINWEDIKVNL